jgi:hypothetical protein
LSDQLLAEIHNWQPVLLTQQDDITLIIIGIAPSACEALQNEGNETQPWPTAIHNRSLNGQMLRQS